VWEEGVVGKLVKYNLKRIWFAKMNTDKVDIYFTGKNRNDGIYVGTKKIYLILLNLYLSTRIMSNTIVISDKSRNRQ